MSSCSCFIVSVILRPRVHTKLTLKPLRDTRLGLVGVTFQSCCSFYVGIFILPSVYTFSYVPVFNVNSSQTTSRWALHIYHLREARARDVPLWNLTGSSFLFLTFHHGALLVAIPNNNSGNTRRVVLLLDIFNHRSRFWRYKNEISQLCYSVTIFPKVKLFFTQR